jgi:hypothetical protein
VRWPWQNSTNDAPTSAPRGESAPSPAGWAFFPPIQRIVGDQPTLTRTDGFTRSLPAWGNPSFMGDMGHLVSSDGPSGVLDADGGGLGAPQLTAYTPELPLLRPARQPESPLSSPEPAGEDDTQPESEVAPVLHRPRNPAVQRDFLEAQGQETPQVSPLPAALPLAIPPRVDQTPALETDESSENIPEPHEPPRALSPVQDSVRQGSAPAGRSSVDPRFNDNATNDGFATVVSLPTARPLQRRADETASRPIVNEPGQRKLGLGSPLYTGGKASEPADIAAPIQRTVGGELPLVSQHGDEPAGETGLENASTPDADTESPTHGRHPEGEPIRSSAVAWPPDAASGSTVGVLSAQRLVTAGLERPLLARPSVPQRDLASTALRAGERPPRATGVVQRATALAPGTPSTPTRRGSIEAFARQDTSPASVQRNFGGLPLALPGESALHNAASSAESAATGAAHSAVSAAERAAAPVENAVAGATKEAAATIAGSSAESPQDVDALADKLMIPLLRRFKSEMLLDRERRGLRTDAF